MAKLFLLSSMDGHSSLNLDKWVMFPVYRRGLGRNMLNTCYINRVEQPRPGGGPSRHNPPHCSLQPQFRSA